MLVARYTPRGLEQEHGTKCSVRCKSTKLLAQNTGSDEGEFRYSVYERTKPLRQDDIDDYMVDV